MNPRGNIEFAAFLGEPEYFNLVSNVKDEHPFVLNGGSSALVVLSKKGFLIEIELLFVQPIPYDNYITYSCKQVNEGIPTFTPNELEKTFLSDPILFIEKNERGAFLLFEPRQSDINTMFVYKHIRFLLAREELIAIEIFHIELNDRDDHKQMEWLKERGMIDDE